MAHMKVLLQIQDLKIAVTMRSDILAEAEEYYNRCQGQKQT